MAPSGATALTLAAGRDAVCRAVHGWLTGSDAGPLLLVTGPSGAGKTFTLAWAASVMEDLAERAAGDGRERFAWLSARGMTTRVAAWALADRLGVTAKTPGQLADGVAAWSLGQQLGGPGGHPGRSGTASVGGRGRVTILISEIDQCGHLRDGASRAELIDEIIVPLLAVPGIRVIVETSVADLPGCSPAVIPSPSTAGDDKAYGSASSSSPVGSGASGATGPAGTFGASGVTALSPATATIIDLADPRWTDRPAFAAWLDEIVPSGGAAAPQAYPNPMKARRILSLATTQHVGLGPATDERPWKLAAVPFDIAFRERIADRIVLEPANLVLAQQPALSTAIDVLGSAVAPGTRAAWRIAGQALTSDLTIPVRAAVLHGAALAAGDDALAEAVAPYTSGTRPSDGTVIGEAAGWLTRWAGWRPLPPDSPRATPWPGPVAALALLPSPRVGEADIKPDGLALIAVDDLTRTHTLDPADGTITTRPAAPVMVKTRALTVIDTNGGAPSVLFADVGGGLSALGPNAPREAIAEIREVLTEAACPPLTALATDGDALAFGDADGRVHVWSLATRDSLSAPATQHIGPASAVAAIWMPDMDVLFALSGGLDGTFRLWAVPADPGPTPIERRGVPVTAITAAVTAACGPVAAVAWADGTVTLWDLAEARTGPPIPLGWVPRAMALGADGLLVVAGDDGLMGLDLELTGFFRDDPVGR